MLWQGWEGLWHALNILLQQLGEGASQQATAGEVSLNTPICLVRYLNSIQTAGGKAASMTTGQATTGWATSHPRWARLSSNEQVSPPPSGGKKSRSTQSETGDWKERKEVCFSMSVAEPV